jgi:MraZ protein
MRGEYTVDAKGRLNFPAKLRNTFGEHFYIAKSIYDKCLVVYNEASWKAFQDKLRDKPQEMSMPILRYVVGCACEAEPDKQGRIAVSQYLRDFAGITTNVTIVTMGDDKAEIWDTELLRENDEMFDQEQIKKLAKRLEI